MVKNIKYSYHGMNKDVSKSKHPNQFYYDAKNIRIVATDSQSSYSITNELGNSLIITIPDVIINTTNNKILYGNKSLSYFQDSTIPEIEKQINDGLLADISTNQSIIGNNVKLPYILTDVSLLVVNMNLQKLFNLIELIYFFSYIIVGDVIKCFNLSEF